MNNRPGVVALVESPAQLLNVVEWAYLTRGRPADAHRVGTGVAIMVLPPPQPAARVQLDRMTELATEAGFEVSWHEVRGARGASLRAMRAARAQVAGASTLVVGDPFSGFLQLMINFSRAEQLVVIDDGSATMEFVEIVNTGRELVRWHRVGELSATGKLIAARARRRMLADRPRRTGRPLELFTSMPVRSDRLAVVRNELAWTRQRYAAPTLLPGADLVGSSLVETGVIDEEHYLRAVAALADRHRIRRYLAHRRESNDKLTKIAALGLTVVRPDLPLELFARIGPVAERVISFPSTVVHTLPLALAGSGVEVLVCNIEQQWFSPGRHSGRSGSFLTSVTDSARRTHGLNAVATA